MTTERAAKAQARGVLHHFPLWEGGVHAP